MNSGISYDPIRRSASREPRYPARSWLITLVYLLISGAVAWAAVVATPIITSIQGKDVIPGEVTLVTTTTFTIKGKSQSRRLVRVWLYKDGEYVTDIQPSLRGDWSIEVTIPGNGVYGFQALASGVTQPFLSAKTKIASVAIDLEAPKINFYHFGGSNTDIPIGNYIRGYNNLLYSIVDDSVAAPATSSGLNFDTLTETMKDLTINKAVPGAVSTDYVKNVWWNPAAGTTWSSGAEIDRHQYQLNASIADKAGNVGAGMVKYYIDATNYAPTILEIYDPMHQEPFTGIGEDASNTAPIYDKGGWVKYYPYMTVYTNPTKVRGKVASWSVPVNTGFDTYQVGSCQRGWGSWVSDVSTTDGSFEIDYSNITPKKKFPIGTYSIPIDSLDAAMPYRCEVAGGRENLRLIYAFGVPQKPLQFWIASGTWRAKSGNILTKSLGDTMVPDMIVKLYPLATDQTAFVESRATGGTQYQIRLAQQVKKIGQVYPDTPGQYDPGEVFRDLNWNSFRDANEPYFDNTPGAYDLGEVFTDLNNNGVWDDGEPYVDRPARGTSISDGSTATLTNFLGLKMHPNYRTCIVAYGVNPLGSSPCLGYLRYVVNNDYPPYLVNTVFNPNPNIVARRTANKPTLISVIAQTQCPGGGRCCSFYGLDFNQSSIRVIDSKGVQIVPPKSGTSVWRRIDKYVSHQADIDVSAVNFPDGTYFAEATLYDQFGHVVIQTLATCSFKIDNVAPNTTDEQPAPGGISNAFSSFNARIIDPALAGDQSEGSGVELNPTKDQIWAFKRLSVDFTPSANGVTQAFPIDTPINGKAVNHTGEVITQAWLTTYDENMEIWEKAAGKFTGVVIASSAIQVTANASNKLSIKRLDGQFLEGKTYVAVIQVPCFTSNDGKDRVGAVPVESISVDGEYFVKIKTLDRAGNQGTVVLNYSRCKMPFGTFTITPSTNLVISALDPPDSVTFTSSQISCMDGSLVLDDQEVTLSQAGPGDVTPPDSNGLPEDGIQIPMGIPSDPPNNGRFQARFVMQSPVTGNTFIAGFIGEASGTSPAVTVNRVQPFSVTPASVILDITPANPKPTVDLTCSNLTDTSLTKVVPDGSIATWTYFTDFDPKSTNLGHSGMSYWNSGYCLDNNLNTTGWHTNSAVAGAFVRVDLGSGYAMPYTKVRLNVQGVYKGIYDVEYSDDYAVWTKAAEGLAPTGYGWVETTWGDVGPHRYWRLLLMNTPGAGGTVREMEWAGEGAQFATDAVPEYEGLQTKVSGGSTFVSATSGTKLVATVNMILGGLTSPNCVLTFRDRYPPPAPAWLMPDVTYSTGSCRLTWPYSIDIGGAGTKDFRLEKSLNGGAFTHVASITMPAVLAQNVVSLADGIWTFRVAARDNDLNFGEYRTATRTVIVDNAGPAAVPCTDNGPGNADPDYAFSADSNVYFYWNATDTLSGVANVNIQVATGTDFSYIVFDGWIGNVNQFRFTEGQHKAVYYARVRAKDRCGNLGGWGAISDGIKVFSKEAMRPPAAPTIVSVASKTVVLGQVVATNQPGSMPVVGKCESENLVEIWVNGVYADSCLGDVAGNYVGSVTLPLGTHSIRTRAQNGFDVGEFSATATVLIEQTPPTMRLRIFAKGGVAFDNRNYISDLADNELHLENLNMTASDTGGSGLDMTTASMTITDIDDAGNPIAVSLPYTNPVEGGTQVLSVDTARFVPKATRWLGILQNAHRYRITCRVADKAGNVGTITRDFVADDVKPGLADGTPPTSPPNNPVDKLFVYDLDAYPWPEMPPAGAIVPLVWNTASGAFMVDQAFVNETLVTDEYSPRAILFNSIGVYGNLHIGEAFNPPVQAGRDSFAYRVEACWGYSSTITAGPDAFGNRHSFRFPYLTVKNGMLSEQFVVCDTAENRDYFPIVLNVRSPSLRPEPPVAVQFHRVGDPATVFTVHAWDTLFPMPGIDIENREVVVHSEAAGLVASITLVPLEVPQTVEIIATGGRVISQAAVASGESQVSITFNQPDTPGRLDFQIRTVANGTRSLTMPRQKNNWYYHWIKNDTLNPEIFNVYPTEDIFNRLSGPDAMPFPATFTVQARDLASDTITSFLRIDSSEASLETLGGSVIPGTLVREYDTDNVFYGFSYGIATTPETDGTYYYVVQAGDAVSPVSHTTFASYPFKLDSIPPFVAKLEPADGEKVYEIAMFNALISDPVLPDGTAGSGVNLDTTRIQIVPYKLLSRGVPTSDTQFTNTVIGPDIRATDHTDRMIAVGENVLLCELTTASRPTDIFLTGTVTANGGDFLSVTSSGLDPSKSYAVLASISAFMTNDEVSEVSAVPGLQIIKGGYYVTFAYPLDKALNRGPFVTSTTLLEAAIGEFVLYPQRTSLYAGLVPPHVATFTSSPIMTTEDLPIPAGIDVTVKTDKGSFVPEDSNGKPRDGHQVKSRADGTITFGLAATGYVYGFADVTAKLALAVASNQSVELIPLPPFTVTPSVSSIDITKANPSPVINFNTSSIGKPGDLVPDGTLLTVVNTFGTLSPADADSTLDGHQVRVKNGSASFSLTSTQLGTSTLTISAGEVVVEQTVVFNDKYPPKAPGDLTFSETLNNTGNFNISCGASTDYAGSGLKLYVLEISTFSGASWGPWKFVTSNKAPIRSFFLTGLDEGRYKFRTYATDNAGNQSDYSTESAAIIVDKTDPTGSMLINGGAAWATSKKVTLNLTANDLNGVESVRGSNDGNIWYPWDPFVTNYSWNLKTGDGNKVVYVQFKDYAGNISITYTDAIILDSTGPTGTFGTSVTYATTRDIKLLFTATDLNGVSAVTISRKGPDGVLATESFPFVPTKDHSLGTLDGTYTYYAQYTDGLGNKSDVFVANVYYDHTPPPAPSMIAEPAYSPGSTNVVYCNAVSDAISPAISYKFQCAPATDFISKDESSWTTEPEWEFTGLVHNQIYYFRVKARDGSGNESPWSTVLASSRQDALAPTGSYIVAPGNTDPDTKYSRDTTVYFVGSGLTDVPSGIKRAYVEVSSDTFSTITWKTNWFDTTTGAVTCTVAVPNGTYLTARAKFEDNAGNVSNFMNSQAIAIDLTNPIATATTDWLGNTDPNHGASKDGKIRFTFNGSIDPGFVPKNCKNQTLTLDEVTLQLEVDDNQAFSSPTIQSTDILSGTDTEHDYNGLADGCYRARIRVKDKSGRESTWGAYSDGIWVDKTAPAKPVVIDDGEYSGIPTVLHASWSAVENGSGVEKYEVCIGTTKGGAEIVPWTNLGTATEHSFTNLTLALDGVTLYYFSVRATDKAGNLSQVGTADGIKAGDPSPPDPVTVTDDGEFTPSSTTLHAIWTQSFDAQSGIDRYEYAIGTASGTTDVLGATSVGINLEFTNSALSLQDGVKYFIHVRAVNGGNTPAPWSVADGITCDLSPPPVPTMSPEPEYSSGTSNIVSCQAVMDATSGGERYEFQRATDAAFSAGVVSSGWLVTPGFSFDGMVHGTKYWFRVRSKDAVENISAWSAAVFSTQDSNPPTGSYIVDPASNLDPDVNWSRDTTAAFIAKNLTDDLSGVQDVHVQIAQVSDFGTTLTSEWLGNKTGAVARTLAVSNGAYLWARAQFKDVAGNISPWYTTAIPIAIDLNAPIPAATTDWVGNTDPNHQVSSDTNIMFTFPGSTDAQFVPKNIYGADGTLKSIEVVVEVSDQPTFGSTSIATDVVLAGTATGYYYSGCIDNRYYRARIKATDHAGWSTWGAYSDGIYIDNSAPWPIAGRAFYINEGQLTTASNGVKLCITLMDWSGIASISVTSNGLSSGSWTTWSYNDTSVFRNESAPQPEGVHHATIYPVPISFPVASSGNYGLWTVTLRARDIYGHESTATESIQYINIASSTPIGNRYDLDEFGERKYPIDTYDEYKGQNKYGVPGSNTGRIMRIGQ